MPTEHESERERKNEKKKIVENRYIIKVATMMLDVDLFSLSLCFSFGNDRFRSCHKHVFEAHKIVIYKINISFCFVLFWFSFPTHFTFYLICTFLVCFLFFFFYSKPAFLYSSFPFSFSFRICSQNRIYLWQCGAIGSMVFLFLFRFIIFFSLKLMSLGIRNKHHRIHKGIENFSRKVIYIRAQCVQCSAFSYRCKSEKKNTDDKSGGIVRWTMSANENFYNKIQYSKNHFPSFRSFVHSFHILKRNGWNIFWCVG